MKKFFLVSLSFCLFLACQKSDNAPTEQQKNEEKIKGKWKLLKVTDSLHHTYTNAEPCFADDTFEFGNGTATLSQGTCRQWPAKEQVLTFPWKFLSANVVDMGGDVVNILQATDDSLVFRRDDPKFLEYHWYR